MDKEQKKNLGNRDFIPNRKPRVVLVWECLVSWLIKDDLNYDKI